MSEPLPSPRPPIEVLSPDGELQPGQLLPEYVDALGVNHWSRAHLLEQAARLSASMLVRVSVSSTAVGPGKDRSNLRQLDAHTWFDPDARTVSSADWGLRLTTRQASILSVLTERRDQVVPRELFVDLYGAKRAGTIGSNVAALRERLGPRLSQYIKTERGKGYSFRSDKPTNGKQDSGPWGPLTFYYDEGMQTVRGVVIPETILDNGSHQWRAEELGRRIGKLVPVSGVSVAPIELTQEEPSSNAQRVGDSDVHYDPLYREVHIAGSEPIALTNMEANLLAYVLAHPLKLCSRGELLENVWRTNRVYGSYESLRVHISRLRRKLGPASVHLRTVNGAGIIYDPVATDKTYHRRRRS